MSEHERQGERTLEMRIAELENKLAMVGSMGVPHQPGAAASTSSFFCFCYCYCFCTNFCVITVERQRGVLQQQAQASPGPMAPFMGGFPGMGY